MARTAYDENQRYFRQAYETGNHGWQIHEPSAYVVQNLTRVVERSAGRHLLDRAAGKAVIACRLRAWAFLL